MTDTALRTEYRPDGVAIVTLSRPDVHNAFDEHLIAALTREFKALGQDERVRAVVLTGAGKSFSAGADLNWMRRTASYSQAENERDAAALAEMMATLNELPKPTVAMVNGAALGGGVGLVCCCDVAVAAEQAIFGTTEVRLGLIPAVIGPYVVAAVGQRHARWLMLSGERIDALEARRIGLVHQTVRAAELPHFVDAFLADLLKNGPNAMAAAKRLILDLGGRPISPEVRTETARRIAAVRASDEGRDGVGAFLDKRKPRWLG